MSFNLEEYRLSMEDRYGAEWRSELRKRASRGGQVKVSKGFGRLAPEARRAIARKGVAARKAKRA